MGCWNGTCGLSGLPIIQGEEIYVFPIVESTSDSFCYATALYQPTIAPFRAIYNDYGAGEECSGPALDLIISSIREKLIELEVGENKCHDIAVKREVFDVDMFFEAVHEKRLRITNPLKHYPDQKPYNEIFFTMVRKDIVDRLWNEWTYDMWKRKDYSIPEGFETDQYYVKNVTYAKLATMIPHFMEFCDNKVNPLSEKMNDIIKKDDPDYAEKFERLNDFYKRHYFFNNREHLLSDTFGHAFGTDYAGGGFARLANFGDTAIATYLSGDKEGAYTLMQEAMIGSMVNSFMESTRKVWLPVMHQGSQSEEYSEYKLMNKITNDVIVAREGYFEEDQE